jgi:hypothetical protein
MYVGRHLLGDAFPGVEKKRDQLNDGVGRRKGSKGGLSVGPALPAPQWRLQLLLTAFTALADSLVLASCLSA